MYLCQRKISITNFQISEVYLLLNSLRTLKVTPLDKQAFRHALAMSNSRRARIAMAVCLFFQISMLFSHWQIMSHNPDPAMRARSIDFFWFAAIWLAVACPFYIFYLVSQRKTSPDGLRLIGAYVIFFVCVCYGPSISILIFWKDGSLNLYNYIIFAFFTYLIFLLRPRYFFLMIVGTCGAMFICFRFVIPETTVLNNQFWWDTFVETVISVSQLGFCVCFINYRNFIKDFNKTYTIEQLNQELAWQIKIDALTGIFNRKEYNAALTRETVRMAEQKKWISVAIMDIDKFKQYNDTYGHIMGDECLYKVAQCLRDNISSPGAVVARYGGEEFSAVLPELPPDEAATIFNKALDAIKELAIEHKASDVAPVVTISIGLYSHKPKPGYDVKESLVRADAQLYRAKNDGRNQMFAEHSDSDN